MTDVYIVEAKRTPIGRFNGQLRSLSAVELGCHLVKSILEVRHIHSAQVDELIFGNVLQAGQGQNMARQIAKYCLGDAVPGLTINKVCGSGLKAVIQATQAIKAGDARLIIAGGAESMSNAPYLLPKARQGYRMGNQEVVDSMVHDGLWDCFNNTHMGITAENIQRKYGISRQDQDSFAVESHKKAIKAQYNARFKEELASVSIPHRHNDPLIVTKDEGPREDINLKVLESIRPAFEKNGTVTAANASSINDGAAVIVVASEAECKRQSLTPLARIMSYATVGIDPSIMGLGPVSAVKKACLKAGWDVDSVELFELNEAFAVQALALIKELGISRKKVNVNGGAIALGHPIGASGARVLVTLVHEMIKQDKKRGVAALCIGGGMGIAIAVER